MTTSAFVMYSIGLLAIALRDVITKVFYSMQDTKSILYISFFSVLINIALNFTLVKPMGHSGLALATSLSAIISIPLFFFILRKKLGPLGLKNTLIIFVKSLLSSFVMMILVFFIYNFFNNLISFGKLGILISICLSAGVGGLIYFLFMLLMNVKEIEYLKKLLFRYMRIKM